MIRKPSVWKAYLFLSKNRSRKKFKLLKTALELVMDKTTAIYLILFFGYIFAAMFIFGDIIEELNPYFDFIEANAETGFWVLLTALPLMYVFKSFSDPGIRFSSSEYQLSLLPYAREKIWLIILIEKLVKHTAVNVVILGMVAILTPISVRLISSYAALILAYEIIMSVPQWKLFQQHLWMKVMLFIMLIGVNAVGIVFASPIAGLVLAGIIMVSHIYLVPRIFKQLNWSRITETSDYHMWNMQLISYASKTKMKRRKQFGIFQNSPKRKVPFRTEKGIHHRMWRVYLFKNYQLLFRLTGALLLMLIVLPFIHDIAQPIGMAIAIYAYNSVMSIFFIDRFRADILQALPWDLPGYRKSFFIWAAAGGTLLLVPAVIAMYLIAGYWVFLYIALFFSVFLYGIFLRLNKSMAILAKKSKVFQLEEGIYFLCVVLVGYSGVYPVLTFAFPVIFMFAGKQMNMDDHFLRV